MIRQGRRDPSHCFRDFAKKKSDLLVTVIRIVPARLMKHIRGPLPKTTLYVIKVNRLLPLVPTFWIKARRVREDIWIDQQDGHGVLVAPHQTACTTGCPPSFFLQAGGVICLAPNAAE